MRKLRQGEYLEGRYLVRELIASGGQAHVYRGTHCVLDRDVAIKLLKNHGADDVRARMVKRFEQEARLISKLRDPHTITLYDFGKLEGGALFMVFEYIDGISLKQLVAEQAPVAPHRVAKILKQTLSSLHEAHSMGVLHRDLKPANIMVFEHAGRKDLAKLLDFGIAKIRREQSAEAMEALTGNNLVGTPRYIAPEVYQSSENLGPRSDIYSLGLVAYELLVGEPAIKGNSAIDVFRQQFNTHSIKLPKSLNIPDGLRGVINKMIERDPTLRYGSSEHVLWALRSWQQTSFVAQHVKGSQPDLDAFDPQDVFIPDPYDDVAPTQNISGDVLSKISFDARQFEGKDMSDTMADLGESSECIKRISPTGHDYPPPRHTPSHGISRSPVTLYNTGAVHDEEFESEAPTQISSIASLTQDPNAAVLSQPGIIPAEVFVKEMNSPDSGRHATTKKASIEDDCTDEIKITDELKKDIARAQARHPRPTRAVPRAPHRRSRLHNKKNTDD